MAMFKDMVEPLPTDERGLTLYDIMRHREEKGVPKDARLHYSHCGSHNMQWKWKIMLTDEEEQAIVDKRAEEARELARAEAPDRAAGF